jgi:N-acetylmuramoyl-L-alanine amidase
VSKIAWLLLVASGVGGAALWARDERPPVVEQVAENGWPLDAAVLSHAALRAPAGFGQRRIFIDAGHGAEGNSGNRSAYCEDEQDFTQSLALELGTALEATGLFEVRQSRQRDALVGYRDRVAAAEQWRAHAFVSLHSDVRGAAEPWQPEDGRQCLRSRRAPGYSVLWSDEAPIELSGRRLRFARAVAAGLSTIGLPAYDGTEYRGLYQGDVEQPGVFVDRHQPGKRIYVLRKTSMPAVIVETHNARDDREVLRWRESHTRQAFCSAIAAALVDALARDGA